ncbi:MAG: hypothetical protein Q9215_004826 [Flavoplaca cf. flavocitrina]
MAGAIGRITAAAAAAYNENQVSLINLNFDFTLLKLEAPKEFGGLGSIMSLKRKTNAESGAFHRTARKLGALFEGTLPEIQELTKAYGIRASEIAQSDKVKTKHARATELFQNQIGADSTSIWAAATSGDAAVSVHLLACMLARVFSGTVATSIWVEIVAGQKLHIDEKQKTANFASAYDAAIMAKQHLAMMNMLDAAKISVNSETNTYRSVITAWIDALRAMSCLVSGTPQRVQNGAILLALSAWHLYPDLDLVGPANLQVRQHDPLISNLGVLTVGLENSALPHDPVTWSLPLAYMRYYGEPKLITGFAGHSNSRVSIDQFAYVIMGSIFSAWESAGFIKEIRSAVTILRRLSSFLKAAWTQGGDVKSHESQSPQGYHHLASTSWLGQVLVAIDRYEESDDEIERSTAMKLVSLGRRHPNFLCSQLSHPAPLFGLSNYKHALRLMTDSERRVSFLRQLAFSIGLDPSRYVIRYKNVVQDRAMDEYATIQPITQAPGHPEGFIKRKDIPPKKNIRWLSISGVNRDPCGCKGPCTPSTDRVDHTPKRKLCKCAPHGCSLLCHDWRKTKPSKCSGLYCYNLASRLAELISYDEECLPVHQCSFGQEGQKSMTEICDFGTGNAFDASLGELYTSNKQRKPSTFVGLTFCAGDPKSACIMTVGANATAEFHRVAGTPKPKVKDQQEQLGACMGYRTTEMLLNKDYLTRLKLAGWFSNSDLAVSLARSGSAKYVSSLMASASATEIYKLLPGATISTTVVSQSIDKALWVPDEAKEMMLPYRHRLSKAQTFACIAMLDTGTFNFDPRGLNNVFAISSGNSIYIAGPLLCDPYEVGDRFEVRHIAGNIGRPGLCLLVPPPNPKIRKLQPGTWNQLNYAPFDGKQENSFSQTSIHLSFTAYELPLQTEVTDQHIIDRPARFIETLVSVYDGKNWVADLDIMSALQSNLVPRFVCNESIMGSLAADCHKSFIEVFGDAHAMVSIDNWDEFLEQSESSDKVVRAHENWLARLAFTVTAVQQDRPLILLPADICWTCLSRKMDAVSQLRPVMIL